jgi:ParB-like chromosome segregation protein Spo0J
MTSGHLTSASPISESELGPAADLGSWPMDDVRLDHLDFGFSPRTESHDPDHVSALADVLPDLPPILVHKPSMRVIDGEHRVLAARAQGHLRIRVAFFDGTEFEASVEAVRRNTVHGKPLTYDERQAAAARILQASAEWSDRRIASVCGLSPKTVARLRVTTPGSTEEGPQLTVRVGRDGRKRPVNPADVRRRIAQAFGENPTASIRGIAERTGAARGTVRDVHNRLQRGEDVLTPRLAGSGDDRTSPQQDESFRASQDAMRFAEWFEAHRLTSNADWEAFIRVIPISRIYEVADESRRCSDVWRDFASALEDRIRGRSGR